MQVANTKLDDATIAKINKSGKSTYQFLKEAVELKIKNDEVLSIEATVEDLIEKKFKQMEQRTKQVNQDLVEQSFGAVLDVFHDIKKRLEDAETKHNTFREGLRITIENIFSCVKK